MAMCLNSGFSELPIFFLQFQMVLMYLKQHKLPACACCIKTDFISMTIRRNISYAN